MATIAAYGALKIIMLCSTRCYDTGKFIACSEDYFHNIVPYRRREDDDKTHNKWSLENQKQVE